MTTNGLAMFRLDQRVSVREGERGVQYRDGTVIRVNQDGSAILKLDGSGEPREAQLWPENCEVVT